MPPVDTRSAPVVSEILDLIADHDAVLATGHLSGPECWWLLGQGSAAGRTSRAPRLTPATPFPGLTAREVEPLAEAGGLEITAYQLLHQPDCSAEFLASVTRAAGGRLILSSDVGQPESPSPPEALEILVDSLAREGVDRGLLLDAASSIPQGLFLR